MRNPVAVALLCAVGLVSSRSLTGAPAEGDEVQVRDYTRERGEVEYAVAVTQAGCELRWVASRTGVNAGIAQLRSDCKAPQGTQIHAPLLASLLAGEPSIKTLFWGGLSKLDMWPAKLAAAAAKSPQWDTRAGKPKSRGERTSVLVQSLLAGALASDLKNIAPADILLELASVEKVQVGTVAVLPKYAAELALQGVGKSARVPYDCLVWFSIVRQKGR
jgi:hypothetical protein